MEIICKIGEGSYFSLFKARLSTKFVVLKTPVHQEMLYQELLRREYELGVSLSHPSIVNTLGFEINTPVGAALILEYIDGESLEDFLAMDPAGTHKKMIVQEVLDAVEYLHKRGICHNDLKPSNIMVTREGHVKIIDFGFSISDDSVYNGVKGGTEGFSAPEVLEGKGAAGVTSDIYSIGALLKYMSASPSAIINRCMSAQPSGRYHSVAALKRAIAVRSRLGIYLAGAAVVLSMLVALLMTSRRSENDLVRKPEISESCRYMETRYMESLEDINSNPCYEWAALVKTEFLLEMISYLENLTFDQQQELQERFSKYLSSLDSLMLTLPIIDHLPIETRDSARVLVDERAEEFL